MATKTEIKERLEELKRRKLELLEAQRNYKQTHQLEFFKPQEQQQPVFDALLDPEVHQIVVLGGNRSGKSELIVVAVCSFLEKRFQWIKPPDPVKKPTSLKINADGTLNVDGATYENDKAYKQAIKEQERDKGKLRFDGPIRIRVLGEDYEKSIGQTLLPKFQKYLRPELIASKRKGQTGVYNQFILKDGSVIDFLTYQQDSASMEGWDGHIVVYDEPPPRQAYIANSRGLVDHGGISLFAMTPLKEPWIADEVVNKASPSTRTFMLRSADNPHISQQALEEFSSKLTDDEKQTRLEGKFLHLQGLVFKEFDRNIHVIKPFDVPKRYTHYVAIDTHPRTEQALLFVAVSERDQVFVVHEIFKHGTPEQVAEWIVDYHDHIHPINTAIIEPSSQGDTNRGDSTFQVIERALAQSNIPIQLGSKDLAGGILKVKQYLKTPNNQPALFFFNTLQRILFEFSHYVWSDWKDQSGRTVKQRPLDRDDHLIENLRRLLQHPVQYMSPQHYSSLLEQANSPYQPLDPIAGY